MFQTVTENQYLHIEQVNSLTFNYVSLTAIFMASWKLLNSFDFVYATDNVLFPLAVMHLFNWLVNLWILNTNKLLTGFFTTPPWLMLLISRIKSSVVLINSSFQYFEPKFVKIVLKYNGSLCTMLFKM